jgi:hypothetical protein
MKPNNRKPLASDDLLPQYDFSTSRPNKYLGRLTKDSPVYVISSTPATARKRAKSAGQGSAPARKRAPKRK